MAWNGGFHLNLSHLSGAGMDGRSSTERESPVYSKKPSTSRLASEDQKKTPRSTSCDVASAGLHLASPKRRKEKSFKAETPRSSRKKSTPGTISSGRASSEKRLASSTLRERKSPMSPVNGTRMASPVSAGARTTREERRSPSSRDREGLKKSARNKKGGRGDLGSEVAAGEAVLAGEPGLEEPQEQLPECAEQGAAELALNELRRLHKYIEQTVSYGAPATTVLQLLDECIACTKALTLAVESLPAESTMLQRDLKDLCQIRHSAGNSHPEPALMLISLNRVMAVAEHLRPQSHSPDWRALGESPPMHSFLQEPPKHPKDSPEACLSPGKSLAVPVPSESNEDEMCPGHFRKLKQGSSPPVLLLHKKEPRARSSSGDLSDCSTCSSDAEIRSMNRHLQEQHSPRSAQFGESPPDSFISDFFSRLNMESGRHFDLGIDAAVRGMDINEHVPHGFSASELQLIADKQLLQLVLADKELEHMQCNVCMGKLLGCPNSMAPEDDSSDSEDEPSGQPPLLTKLPCQHVFHDSCIEKWFFFGRSCPVCRAAILPSERCAPEQPMSAPPAPIAEEPEEMPEEQLPSELRVICPDPAPLAVPTRQRQMIRVPALPLHSVKSSSEHSTPRTPSAPNSARLPMSPRSAFTDIKSHRSTTESESTPRSELAYVCTPRSEPRCTPRSAR